MGATGLELHPHQRQGAEPTFDPIMRDRLSPIGAHRHLHPLGAMTADGFRDGATPGERAVAEREVFTADLARRERPHQRGMGLRRSGDQHRPCRILVEAVHDPGTRHERKRRIERKQRVLKRSTAVARPRVHHQACRLVDHPERRIPMQHAERHPGVARRHALVGHELGRDTQGLAAHEPAPSHRRGIRIDLHAAVVDPTLQPGARVLRQQLRQRDVQALAGQGCGDGDLMKFRRRGRHGVIMNW